jgi:hypothetical protein
MDYLDSVVCLLLTLEVRILHSIAKPKYTKLKTFESEDLRGAISGITCASKSLTRFADQNKVEKEDLVFKLYAYGSERDIEVIVCEAIKDALVLFQAQCKEECKSLKDRMERGLFLCRPVIVVVFHQDIPILAIK